LHGKKLFTDFMVKNMDFKRLTLALLRQGLGKTFKRLHNTITNLCYSVMQNYNIVLCYSFKKE